MSGRKESEGNVVAPLIRNGVCFTKEQACSFWEYFHCLLDFHLTKLSEPLTTN